MITHPVRLTRRVRVYGRALRDPRTPWLARIAMAAAVLYAIWPLDIAWDFVPLVGVIDDLVLVSLLLKLAVRLIPGEAVRDAELRIEEGWPA
jgi:uncharacterized membrane protein YkvA (DUF1232 family)